MPGLSVACGDAVGGSDDSSGDEHAFEDALDATAVLDHYATTIDLEGDGVAVGSTEYDGYPIRRAETEHGTAFLEGELYDVEDPDAHLERVAAMIADDDLEGLRAWVGARDGDYLLAVADGDAVAMLNDPFGRLPAYTATIGGATVCSRELGFVRALASGRDDPLELDRLALAQLLSFGYPLGNRTPFAEVRTVPPGSLVRFGDATDSACESTADAGPRIESLYEHDFDDCTNDDRDVETNADELADRIATACQRRASPDRPTVVSLSGGLDSRIAAAAYDASDLPATATTFQRGGGSDAEVGAAGAVAKRLGLDWRVYDVESSPERRRTLLETKQGTNYLGMAFILDFFEQLRNRHGTATYVTGDGGDKVLVDLEPATTPGSESELVDHAIAANSRLSLETAADVANVDADAIRASVAQRIGSYPESDLARRYVHFLVRERGVNFLVQGEDRNRYYAWSVSPFYALPVFEYAMNCPDDQKAYRGLVAAILERFDPGLVDLPYPNYGAPISTRRYRAKQFVYDALERYPAIRGRVVDLVTGDGATPGLATEAIRGDLPWLDRAGLSAAATAGVLESPEAHSRIQFQYLSTVTALARAVVTDAESESPPEAAATPATSVQGAGAEGAGGHSTTSDGDRMPDADPADEQPTPGPRSARAER
ncbi:asparagine synthase (glutamine-hydrolyzing) [Salinarchaeum sp. Harcht-Bsk1]|uniref:asparagine synthase-related protein n=1 Tax=Salinarchaeum sp. Harcht-Bsk1 TaxID=1333523 RepID=UPI0003423040|nr:asparagine synthase-related protein [Salinarchaeum sp. Harcht-Bsk1]AGN00965.1 asparagine synthase (glutamine-hydrolyzing) [Salinarchaeum sp. Harcht-Bsk1]